MPLLDPHLAARVQPPTIGTYQTAGALFSRWCLERSLHPTTAAEWDDILMEYKQENIRWITKSKFANTVAAVEFFFPRLRGDLATAHQILRGWGISEPIKHTVPLGKNVSKLVGIHFASQSCFRMGLGVVLQAHTGLRPGELRSLRPCDIFFPEEAGATLETLPVVIALGVRKSTKVKRAQTVRITKKDADLVMMLERVVRRTPVNAPIFPFSHDEYRRRLRQVDALLGANAGWTPHSPRAGFASDSRAEGLSFEETREAGRWQADSSLRTYLDIVSALDVTVKLRGAGHGPALAWASRFWWQYWEHGTF